MNEIIRRVRVNRARTARQSIEATGRALYVDGDVLATMPVGQGPEEVELVYFKPGRYLNNEELAQELEARGLVPDPQAQAADNEVDPAFADEHPNGCIWDRDGKVASCACFDRRSGEREVGVGRSDRGWDDCWWFAGVRKIA